MSATLVLKMWYEHLLKMAKTQDEANIINEKLEMLRGLL